MMERVDKEQDGSGEGKTWSNSSETEVAGSNSAATEAEGPSDRQKIAAHGDDDDLEEGEIRDEGGPAQPGEVRVMCSLYQKGACVKGHKCSFFHASVGEKGQYQMFDRPVKTNLVPPANFQPLRLPPPRAEYFNAVPPSDPWNNYIRPSVDRFGRELRYRQRSERFRERDEFPHSGHEASQWHDPWSSRQPASFWSHERSSHRSRSRSSSRSESRSPSPRSRGNKRSKARHAQRKRSSNSPYKTRTHPRSRPRTKQRSKSRSESSDSDASRSSPDFKSRSNHKPRSYSRSRSGSSLSRSSSPDFKSNHRPVSYNKSRSGSNSSRLRSHSAKQSRSSSRSRSTSGSESDSNTHSSTCSSSEGPQLPLRTETADYNDQCERPLSPEVQEKKVQRQSSGYNRSEPKEDENRQKGTLLSERQPQSSGYLRREPLEDDNGQKGKIRFRMDQAAMGKLQVPKLKRPAWEIPEESPPKKKCVSPAANTHLSEPPAPEHQKRSSKPTLKKQDASALSTALPLCSTSSSSLSPDSGVSLSPSVNHCSRPSQAATAPQCVSVRQGSKRTNDRVRREEPRQPSAEGSCPSSNEQSQSGKSFKERMLEELQKVQLQIAKKKAYVNRSKKV